MTSPRQASSGIFYGWWVAAAFSVMTFISTGVRHAVGPFLKPIVADLGLDRASFSLVIALEPVPLRRVHAAGRHALDRFGVRAVTSVGTVLLVASRWSLTAMVPEPLAVRRRLRRAVPLGLAGTGPVIASGVVARWFSKRRGTALSVLGSAIDDRHEPARARRDLADPHRGLAHDVRVDRPRRAGRACCRCACWSCATRRSRWASAPDGDPLAAGTPRRTSSSGRTAGEALRTLAFWQLAGSFFTCGFSMSLLSAARHADAHRPRLHADVRLVGARRARRLQHRLHRDAGRALRSLRPAARAGHDLRGARLDLRGLVPHPRQSGRDHRRRRRSAASRWRAPGR